MYREQFNITAPQMFDSINSFKTLLNNIIPCMMADYTTLNYQPVLLRTICLCCPAVEANSTSTWMLVSTSFIYLLSLPVFLTENSVLANVLSIGGHGVGRKKFSWFKIDTNISVVVQVRERGLSHDVSHVVYPTCDPVQLA